MTIHPQLQADTVYLGRFELCHLLLMKDANYPWLILVPDLEEVTEIYQLSPAQQQQLMQESSSLAQELMRHFQGDKMNIAALGNVVSQLHIHHVVRFRGDAAWPAPVWGHTPARPYAEDELQQRIKALQGLLHGSLQQA